MEEKYTECLLSEYMSERGHRLVRIRVIVDTTDASSSLYRIWRIVGSSVDRDGVDYECPLLPARYLFTEEDVRTFSFDAPQSWYDDAVIRYNPMDEGQRPVWVKLLYGDKEFSPRGAEFTVRDPVIEEKLFYRYLVQEERAHVISMFHYGTTYNIEEISLAPGEHDFY